MKDVLLQGQTGLRSIGRDSMVFSFPGDDASLLKFYDNLSVYEIMEYHRIHGKYGSRGVVQITPNEKYLQYAESQGWGITFLGQEVRGAIISVLDLSSSEVIENPEGRTLAKIPLVNGKNLADHMYASGNEIEKYVLRILENMALSGLEQLGVPIEKRKKGGEIIQQGHTIGRDNLMISGIEDGIVHITATDIGFDIPDSLEIERKLDGQSVH